MVASYFTVRAFGPKSSLFAFIFALPALAMTWVREEKTPVPASPGLKAGRAAGQSN